MNLTCLCYSATLGFDTAITVTIVAAANVATDAAELWLVSASTQSAGRRSAAAIARPTGRAGVTAYDQTAPLPDHDDPQSDRSAARQRLFLGQLFIYYKRYGGELKLPKLASTFTAAAFSLSLNTSLLQKIESEKYSNIGRLLYLVVFSFWSMVRPWPGCDCSLHVCFAG